MQLKNNMQVEERDYDFPVELKPIFALREGHISGISIEGRRAVVRMDTNKVIGIVSDKYQLLRHGEVIESFNKAFEGMDFVSNFVIKNNGSRMFARYSFPNNRIEVREGDFISMQLIVKNSYDGNSSLQIMLGAFRLVCSNGMVLGNRVMNFRQRHIGEKGEIDKGKIDGEEIRAKVEFMVERFTATLPSLKVMAETNLKDIPADELFTRKRFRLPQYLIEKAKVNYNEDGDHSNWGVYNALTNAISHNMRRENTALAIEYGRRVWSAMAQ